MQLVAALGVVDDENRYVILHRRGDKQNHFPIDAVNFVRNDLWTPSHHRLERWTLSAELLRHRLDVLHSPDFIPPWQGAKRYVITVHDLNFLHFPELLTSDSRRYYNGQIQWAVRKADFIAADSEATRHDILTMLGVPPEKVHTIHLAAHPAYAAEYEISEIAATLKEFDLPDGFVLFVGTVEPRKNVGLLLKAFNLLRAETGYDLPLVIVGSSGWRDEGIRSEIEDMMGRGLVRRLSDVPYRKLAHLYHAAGVSVLPSLYEGFGLPALEAMHAGCPVIVSSRGSLPEIVGEAGRVLAPHEPGVWASAIAEVLGDGRLRSQMIRAGRARAAHFTWQRTAQQTQALYVKAAQLDRDSE